MPLCASALACLRATTPPPAHRPHLCVRHPDVRHLGQLLDVRLVARSSGGLDAPPAAAAAAAAAACGAAVVLVVGRDRKGQEARGCGLQEPQAPHPGRSALRGLLGNNLLGATQAGGSSR